MCGSGVEHIRQDTLGRRVTRFYCGWVVIELPQGTIALKACSKVKAFIAKYGERQNERD
jgi:hypothetical protein